MSRASDDGVRMAPIDNGSWGLNLTTAYRLRASPVRLSVVAQSSAVTEIRSQPGGFTATRRAKNYLWPATWREGDARRSLR